MTTLRAASQYYLWSQRLAARAARRARRESTLTGVAAVVMAHQATQAAEASSATMAMLGEQGISTLASATLAPLAFTTPQSSIEAMLDSIDVDARGLFVDWQFQRLVESLVQDAGRAAQSVSAASIPRVQHVRHLNLPSCSRCAVLAGRVYRYSDGFQRHPGCDCVMVPVTGTSSDLTYDPVELVRSGQITGLSQADQRAIQDGADFNKVVNWKSRGLPSSTSAVRSRTSDLTVDDIYQRANSRPEAVELLRASGYIRAS